MRPFNWKLPSSLSCSGFIILYKVAETFSVDEIRKRDHSLKTYEGNIFFPVALFYVWFFHKTQFAFLPLGTFARNDNTKIQTWSASQ